jgi:hypothetical protein
LSLSYEDRHAAARGNNRGRKRPRRPVLRRAVSGIIRHGISITGTGTGRVCRAARVSIGRGIGVGGVSRVARQFIPRRTGVSGATRVAWVCVARRAGVSGATRVAWVA